MPPGVFELSSSALHVTPDTPAGVASGGKTVVIEHLRHRYGSLVAVDDVSLSINAGEVVALLGPSGCGKTTLLRTIAGFVTQQSGRVLVDGQSIDLLPANRRNVGIVFQNYALFPHMTVAENIAYGLVARGVGKTEQRARVAEMLATVRMEGFAARKPRQLSGGQQQRIALARALAVQPRILLLDEPFAALDKNLRLDMQMKMSAVSLSNVRQNSFWVKRLKTIKNKVKR
jgi:putative spermidine/putrescine transport system ATP-binding protein